MANLWRRNTSFRIRATDLFKDTVSGVSHLIAGQFFEAPEGGPSYFGILKRWTGLAWVKEPLKTWLAGSWQAKPMKRWSGTEWLLVDTTGA